MTYKRNQIEDAAESLFRQWERPTAGLRTRLKRLLEMDGEKLREDGPSKRARRQSLAFRSVESPGTGAEIWFSEYEALALLLGLMLLDHGWPQGAVANILREARGKLEPEHARILRKLRAANRGPVQKPSTGGPAARPDGVFFCISSPNRSTSTREGTNAFAIYRSEAEMMKALLSKIQSFTIYELIALTRSLSTELSRSEPRKRGRRGGT